MKQTIAAVIFAAAAAMTITAAMAAETTIGGASISLPTPSGFCELSSTNASDNRMLTGLGSAVEKSGNKFLGMSADCQQLTDWHTAKRKLLDDFGQYQTPLAMMDRTVPEAGIKATCAELRGQGEKIMADVAPKAKANVEEAFSKIKVNETKLLGVLAEDPDACYAAMLQKLQTEVGTDKTSVIVFADTVVKGKHILIYHIARYEGADTVTSVLARLKANVTALYAANK